MFSFPDDFPGTVPRTLSVNFRSGRRILGLANAIVDRFERPRGEKRKPLNPGPDAPQASIEAFVAPHGLEEAEGIAERIASAGPPWTQYAVLTRRRSEFQPIFRALGTPQRRREASCLSPFGSSATTPARLRGERANWGR